MSFLSNAEFSAQRPQILKEMIALKTLRRVVLGPDISVVFEHPRLIWWHIQEMLRVENGGTQQLQEEWDVYSALLPNPHSITFTMMIEIDDPVARKKALEKRRGIEYQVFLEGAGFCLSSRPVDMDSSTEPDKKFEASDCESAEMAPDLQAYTVDTSAVDLGLLDKDQTPPTSSVHFLRFSLNEGARQAFSLGEPVLSCQHPHALYRAPIPRALWLDLCQDLGIQPATA
jgi:hypothetical protein